MPIKVVLLEDEEIRAQIKELIKDQVRLFTRAEIFGIVQEEMDKRLKDLNIAQVQRQLDAMAARRIVEVVDQYVKNAGGSNKIQYEIDNRIRELVKDRIRGIQ